MTKMPDYEKARDYIVNRLANELSPRLTYHRLEHTTNEVVPAAEHLARLENIQEEELLLLLTAAYYHDTGFIHQRQDHEAASIQLAEQILPQFGYAQTAIAVVRGLILTTRIPQTPTNLLERIMADADLDYLGADNFWERSLDLRQELANFGTRFIDTEWYIYQLRFIQEHRYFTDSERTLRDTAKQQHVLEIQKQFDLAYQTQKSR